MFNSHPPPPHLSMLCWCERNKQTTARMMSNNNIDLGERGVSSVPALMAKIVLEESKNCL